FLIGMILCIAGAGKKRFVNCTRPIIFRNLLDAFVRLHAKLHAYSESTSPRSPSSRSRKTSLIVPLPKALFVPSHRHSARARKLQWWAPVLLDLPLRNNSIVPDIG